MQDAYYGKTRHVVCTFIVLFRHRAVQPLYTYRIVAENLVKYVPPDGFFGIQILQKGLFFLRKLFYMTYRFAVARLEIIHPILDDISNTVARCFSPLSAKR